MVRTSSSSSSSPSSRIETRFIILSVVVDDRKCVFLRSFVDLGDASDVDRSLFGCASAVLNKYTCELSIALFSVKAKAVSTVGG